MMDAEKWLEFTIYTGLDKYRKEITELIKVSKRLKNNFYYMKVISTVYLYMEDLLDEIKEIV